MTLLKSIKTSERLSSCDKSPLQCFSIPCIQLVPDILTVVPLIDLSHTRFQSGSIKHFTEKLKERKLPEDWPDKRDIVK